MSDTSSDATTLARPTKTLAVNNFIVMVVEFFFFFCCWGLKRERGRTCEKLKWTCFVNIYICINIKEGWGCTEKNEAKDIVNGGRVVERQVYIHILPPFPPIKV